MSKKRKIALAIGCIILLALALVAGRYWLPDCPTCPDCPEYECPECPECPSCPVAPTLTIEKWIQDADCNCGWQKEISAEKGDWIKVKVTVNVTGTMNNVWVKDAALVRDPWSRVRDLEVNGVAVSGDIADGISLGKLTDESREITFCVELSKSNRRYSCGVNTLENVAEAGDCGYQQAAASVKVIVDVYCPPASYCKEPEEPEEENEPPEVVTH